MRFTSLVIILILSVAFNVGALEWKTTNQATVEWDIKTDIVPGTPIPAGNEIRYNVYLANSITDPDHANPVKLTTEPITATSFLVTLGGEGKYHVGVSAVRYDNGELVDESSINWSDVNGEATPNPFGIRYYVPMSNVKGLRK